MARDTTPGPDPGPPGPRLSSPYSGLRRAPGAYLGRTRARRWASRPADAAETEATTWPDDLDAIPGGSGPSGLMAALQVTLVLSIGAPASAGAVPGAGGPATPRSPPGPSRQVPSPSVGADVSELRSVSCVDAALCMAVGQGGNRPAAPRAVERLGLVGGPGPNPLDRWPASVGVVHLAHVLRRGGWQRPELGGPGQHALNIIEQWNGSGWSLVTSPNLPGGASDNLHTVSCTGPQFC